MRHHVVLAIFMAVAGIGPDLRVHMLTRGLVCKLLLDLLEQYVLIEVLLAAMHLLCLATAIYAAKLLHVEAVPIHILELVWTEVLLHSYSILHILPLRAHWATMNEALDSLVSHVWHLLICEEVGVSLSHQTARRLVVWVIMQDSLSLLRNLRLVSLVDVVMIGTIVCPHTSSNRKGGFCSAIAISVCLVIRVAIYF